MTYEEFRKIMSRSTYLNVLNFSDKSMIQYTNDMHTERQRQKRTRSERMKT